MNKTIENKNIFDLTLTDYFNFITCECTRIHDKKTKLEACENCSIFLGLESKQNDIKI